MASETVMLWCTLHPAPGKEAETREVLLGLAAKVQEVEKTCLRYEVFEKTDHHGMDIVFYLLEKWPSEADLERHTRRDWLIAIREQFDSGLLAKDELIEKVSNIGGFQT